MRFVGALLPVWRKPKERLDQKGRRLPAYEAFRVRPAMPDLYPAVPQVQRFNQPVLQRFAAPADLLVTGAGTFHGPTIHANRVPVHD